MSALLHEADIRSQEYSTDAQCPLCGCASVFFDSGKWGSYYKCSECSGIFLHEKNRMNETDEKNRYLLHRNDVNDKGYRSFVSPLVNAVRCNHTPSDKGLDYGSGPHSAASTMLEESSYPVSLFDPFFQNKAEVLDRTYDYIILCEVMEHFYFPLKEFSTLYKMLNENGKLYCMTSLYDESITFKTWHYVSDPCHVFFYSPKTLSWINKNIGFTNHTVDERLIIFEK